MISSYHTWFQPLLQVTKTEYLHNDTSSMNASIKQLEQHGKLSILDLWGDQDSKCTTTKRENILTL